MSQVIFAYFGPETVLPLTSTLAAAVGVALMFGRQVRLLCMVVLYITVLRVLRRETKPQKTALPRAGKRIDRATPAAGPQMAAGAGVVSTPEVVAANQVES